MIILHHIEIPQRLWMWNEDISGKEYYSINKYIANNIKPEYSLNKCLKCIRYSGDRENEAIKVILEEKEKENSQEKNSEISKIKWLIDTL